MNPIRDNVATDHQLAGPRHAAPVSEFRALLQHIDRRKYFVNALHRRLGIVGPDIRVSLLEVGKRRRSPTNDHLRRSFWIVAGTIRFGTNWPSSASRNP